MDSFPSSDHAAAHAVFAHLAGKWSASILRTLSSEPRRFSQLRSRIAGISEKVLAQTLRELERDGLILRTSYPVVPPHVVYSLTALGATCTMHVATIMTWLSANETAFVRAHCRYDDSAMTADDGVLEACERSTDSGAAA